MIKTSDKIILGVLTILLVGMSAVFISAVSSSGQKRASLNEQLSVTDITPEKTSATLKSNFEEEDDEEDVPIIGTPLERASAAALAYIGKGRVTDSEIGDEEGYYEIEITLDNGNEVDVHLDENFRVLSAEYEDEDEEDD